jgi:ectoine hydroxylase-related dioxygenase (phytanoyl-CoA dioxygenase family)
MKEEIINSLNEAGICVVPNFYSKEFCEQAVADIEDGLVNFKDKVQSSEREGTSGDYRLFKMENQYETGKVFANEQLFVDVLNEYCGQAMKSHFVLGGKVQHNEGKITNSGGGWHRDNRMRQLKTIVYLTDVNEKNGPYLFLPHSDKFDLPTRDGIGKVTRYEDKVINEFCKENDLDPFLCTGEKGTVIFTDTSFIHRGSNIEEGIRYSYTNYYFEDNPMRYKLTEDNWGSYFI